MATNRFHHPPSNCALVEVHAELIDQLFSSIDPSPHHTRDMDRSVDAFIVNSVKAMPKDAPLALTIHLNWPPADPASHCRHLSRMVLGGKSAPAPTPTVQAQPALTGLGSTR